MSGSVSKVDFVVGDLAVGDLAFFFSTLAFSFASCFSLSCTHHREIRGEGGGGRGGGAPQRDKGGGGRRERGWGRVGRKEVLKSQIQ